MAMKTQNFRLANVIFKKSWKIKMLYYGKYTENLQDEYGPQYLVVKVELTDWHLFVNFFP
jgi:hypothetical protein